MTTPRPIPMRSVLTTGLMVLLVTACATPAIDPSTTTVVTTITPSATTSSTVASATPTDTLATARDKWAAAGLDTYHFVLEDDCGECDPDWAIPREVVVWDGEVLDGLRRNFAVGDLFDAIEAAIRSGVSVEVTYHDQLGYPIEVWIDRQARAYDGGTHLLLHDVASGLPGLAVTSSDLEAARRRWAAARPPAYEYRTDILCDCSFDTTLWTLVEESRVVDWRVEWSRDSAPDISPLTMEQLFDDLHRLITEGEVVEGGARISGGAAYHPELGYPTWIGLDIEILDPTSPLGDLPPRLVFVIRDVKAHDLAETAHDRAVDRWAGVGPSDYRYHLTVHDIAEGTFGPPHVVAVMNDSVVSVTVDGTAVDPTTVPAFAIDDLLDQIERWTLESWEVEVIYDDRLGHPVLVIASLDDIVLAFSIDGLRPE
jgi:hypothetical protein